MSLVCRSSVLACSVLVFFMVGLFLSFGFLGEGSLLVDWVFSGFSVMDVNFPFVLDWMSVSFSFVVCLISFFVIMFATSYMSGEKNLSRFIWLVMLFVLSMNFLIFVPSIMSLILGWDGLGLVSFLLVAYYQNYKSLGAALVTAFMNRVGDAFLLLGICLLGDSGHWFIWGHLSQGTAMMMVFMMFIVMVSMTKSAQVPFSYWLPAAMNAPTPVSALVHSSTLVTAGVYLLIRVFYGMEVESVGVLLLLWVSLFTMNMAGFSACFEVDLKKVVALSTLSQLGVMMFSLSLGYYVLAFFHLMSHALFKALMFVSVGRVIHGHKDSQELRDISGLWLKMPLTGGCLVLASMSLMGLPFLSGFYSKDLVVESLLVKGFNSVVLVLIMFAMVGTVMYSFRVFFCSVWGKSSGIVSEFENQSVYEVIPSLGLSLGAVWGGYFMQSVMFSFGGVFVLEGGYKILLLGMIIVTIVLMMLYSLFGFSLLNISGFSNISKLIQSFFVSMWFLSYVAWASSLVGLGGGRIYYKEVDLGWNELVFGGMGLFSLMLQLSYSLMLWLRKRYNVWLWFSFIVIVFMVQV